MNAKKIKGLKLAGQFLTEIAEKVTKFQNKNSLTQQMAQPRLAIILLGNHPASLSYIKRKRTNTSKASISSRLFQIKNTEETPQVLCKQLEEQIAKLNQNLRYHGILLQLPLPAQISDKEDYFLDLIKPEKDVDCLGKENREVFKRKGKDGGEIMPCVVQAVIRMLQNKKIDLNNKNILIIGKGKLGGSPLSIFLQKHKYSYQSADLTTPLEDLKKMVSESDIILTATGKQDIVPDDCFKKGCVIIDIGCSPDPKKPEKVRGDFSEETKQKVCSYYSPVPKGVGPMTVASLANNVYKAWVTQCKINKKQRH